MIKVELEIGDNLKESINCLINPTDKENSRYLDGSISPGREIKKAFKIDLTRIAVSAIKKSKNSGTNTSISLSGEDL